MRSVLKITVLAKLLEVGYGLAGLFDTCEGWDEMNGAPFPDCEEGLVCVPAGGFSITGAGYECVEPAEEGDICGGFDELTGEYAPPCAEGLECQ